MTNFRPVSGHLFIALTSALAIVASLLFTVSPASASAPYSGAAIEAAVSSSAEVSEGEAEGPEFSPVEPKRVLDTRKTGRVTAGSVVEVGLPVGIRSVDEVSAAVLTVTVVDPDGWGFVTVFPCGSAIPDASNINYDDGLTRAATVFSKLGESSRICIFTHAGTDLLVDVTGVFYNNSAFTALRPFRLMDTRKSGTATGGSSLPVPVIGRGGVAANATHAVVTVTAVKASGWGFLTAYACGGSVPEASNVNYDTGWTVANQAIVPLSASGELCVFTHADTDILVDVVGYFTGIDSIDAPTRIADTRPENSGRYTSRSMRPGTWDGVYDQANMDRFRVILIDASQVGSNVSSIYANITVIPHKKTSGFVAPVPCGVSREADVGSSVVNYDGGVIANSAVLDVNRAGFACVMVRDYKQSAATVDIAVDVIGWAPSGWDTDGDGIEDTDETENCRTTVDCDGDGTADLEEEAPCELNRGCSEYDTDETDRKPDDGSGNDDGDSDDICADSQDCDNDGLNKWFDPDDNNPDVDGDGVLDGHEQRDTKYRRYSESYYRCVQDVDCDDDGVLDGDEEEGCVLNPDCDGDRVLDGDEESGCMALSDCDNDGLRDELDPNDRNPDIDGDGVSDKDEELDWSSDDRFRCLSDPDCDDDGVLDGDEEEGCVLNPDCDGDSILDGDEDPGCKALSDCDRDGLRAGLDPNDSNPDIDGDGVKDGDERTDYTGPEQNRYRCVVDPDCDDDGVLDGDEEKSWCVLDPDCDGDGLLDSEEETGCTLKADCDYDGVNDPAEESGCTTAWDCDDDGLGDQHDPEDKNPDIDGDGLRDGAEAIDHWADNPYRCLVDPDCDDDSVLDADEEGWCQLLADCDWDGLDDRYEESGCVTIRDCDSDGLGDVDEASGCAKTSDCDSDGQSDLYDAFPTTTAISLGGGIVAHDMKTARAADFADTWTYGLYYCDAYDVAGSFDRWGSKFSVDGVDFNALSVLALTQEGFNELSETLLEGRIAVNVLLKSVELADPTTGECSFPGVSEALDSTNEGVLQVASHLDTTKSYAGLASYGSDGPSWFDMNANGFHFKSVLAHEFGHNLRWKHANYSVEGFGNWAYDSHFDIMGSAWANVTTFDRLLQIGAISANQIIGHNSGTTNATLEAHAHYRGSVAPSNSKRGILVAPNGTPYTRNGGNVLLGIEPAKTSSRQGVVLNFMEIGEYVDGNYLVDSNRITGWSERCANGVCEKIYEVSPYRLTASHPLAADEWTDSFVGVGQTKTFFGVTVTVHSQDSDGTTNITVSGSLTSGQWAAAVQSLFAATADSHDGHCGVMPSSVPFNPAPATQIGHVASGYELRSRTALMERIQQDGSQTGDPPSIDGPDGDSSLQPGLEPEHGYGCGCCC